MSPLLTTEAVAKLVGLDRRTIEYHVTQGHLAPDVTLRNGSKLYKHETVARFRERHIDSLDVTIPEIIKLWGTTESTLRWHLRKKKIQPSGRNHGRLTYALEVINALAREMWWPGQNVTPERVAELRSGGRGR